MPVVLAVAATPVAHAQDRMVLTGATLIDGTGRPPIRDARIVIEGDRIRCVSGPDGCPDAGGHRVRRLTGEWITPGLIDTHVHLPLNTRSPEILLREQRIRFALGITTVRDAGSFALDKLLVLKPLAESALVPTPRLVVSGRLEPGNADRYGVPNGPPLVRRLKAAGVDAIKLKQPMFNDTIRDAIRTAHALGMPVFGHTWTGMFTGAFTREAIPLGLSGVSHMMALAVESQPVDARLEPPTGEPAFWAWVRGLWSSVDSVREDSLITAMTSAGVWLEPTVTWEYYWDHTIRPPRDVSYLGPPPSLRERFFDALDDSPPPPLHPESWAAQAEFLRRFHDRGGILVTGSDMAPAGLGLHEEIRLIAAATGSPMAGLLAATRDAARALRRDDIGTVEVGKLADLTVYGVDPLGAPGATRRVDYVVKGGTIYDQGALSAEFRSAYLLADKALWQRRARRWLPPVFLLFAVPFPTAFLRRKLRRSLS